VPAPCRGGVEGLEQVLDMVEEAAEPWLDRIQAKLEPSCLHLQRSPRR